VFTSVGVPGVFQLVGVLINTGVYTNSIATERQENGLDTTTV